MEELEHRRDQDAKEQKEQQKEKEEIPTAWPRDKTDGDGQTMDAGNDVSGIA